MAKKIKNDDQQTFVKPKAFNEYGPGSFATHEAAYMVAFLRRAFDQEVRLHRAIRASEKLLDLTDDIASDMATLYRRITENKL